MANRSRVVAAACRLGVAILLVSPAGLRAQDSPEYASRLPQYLPLESVRSGTVRMPEALARRVSVTLEKAPLQRVLMEIATQAGLGLSYGEDLVRAAPMISVRSTAARPPTRWRMLSKGRSGRCSSPRRDRWP